MKFLKYCIPAVLILAACGRDGAGKATVLYYAERDQGGEPYRTRIVITGRWLRIDEGGGARDFLLFDRRDGTLYSVNSMDTRILVMPARTPAAQPPVALEHRTEKGGETPPAVGGRPVTHYRLFTNGEPCYDLFAAEGLLPEAVRALREYRAALAGQQADALAAMPKELQTPCDLANNVFAPARYLDHGLPVRLSETGARTSELVDYSADFPAEAALFDLPANYKRATIEELRGG